MTEKAPGFECLGCGECCLGQGGIHLDFQGLIEAAAFLGLSADDFARRYAIPGAQTGAWEIAVGEDGFCILCQSGRCLIHPVKPKVCALWPFLYGPLKNQSAFEEMKAACPGLAPALTWDGFKGLFAESGMPEPLRQVV